MRTFKEATETLVEALKDPVRKEALIKLIEELNKATHEFARVAKEVPNSFEGLRKSLNLGNRNE